MKKAAERQRITAKSLKKHLKNTSSQRSLLGVGPHAWVRGAREASAGKLQTRSKKQQDIRNNIFKDLRFPFFGSQVFGGGRFTCKNTVFSNESSSKRSAQKAPKRDPKTTPPGQTKKGTKATPGQSKKGTKNSKKGSRNH